jgi:hypothetical protein
MSGAARREFLAGEMELLTPGDQVVAVFDDSHGGIYRIAGELRAPGSKTLLVGPKMVRTGAGIVATGLRLIEPATPSTVLPVGLPERIADVLIAHQRADAGSCLCGWDKLGASHADHIAQALIDQGAVGDAALIVERVRKAFTDMWSSSDWDGQVSIGFASTFEEAVDHVLADYAPTTNELLAAISAWIDESPSYINISPALADTWRVAKLIEEVGEAVAALMGSMGENPRKGVTHTRSDLEHELLDIVAAGMGALMHFHDNDPAADILGFVIEHIRTRAVRGVPHGLVMPAGKEPIL